MSSYFTSLTSRLFGYASDSAAADQPKSKQPISGSMVTTDGTRVVTPNLTIGQSLADVDGSQPLVEGEAGVDESGRLTFTAAKVDGFFNKIKNFFYSLVVDHVFGLKDIWSGIVSLCSSSTPKQKISKEKAARIAKSLKELNQAKKELNKARRNLFAKSPNQAKRDLFVESIKELNQAREVYRDAMVFHYKHPTVDPAGREKRRNEYVEQIFKHYNNLDKTSYSAEERADYIEKGLRREEAMIDFLHSSHCSCTCHSTNAVVPVKIDPFKIAPSKIQWVAKGICTLVEAAITGIALGALVNRFVLGSVAGESVLGAIVDRYVFRIV